MSLKGSQTEGLGAIERQKILTGKIQQKSFLSGSTELCNIQNSPHEKFAVTFCWARSSLLVLNAFKFVIFSITFRTQ